MLWGNVTRITDEIPALFDGKLSFNAMIYLKNCCTRGNEE